MKEFAAMLVQEESLLLAGQNWHIGGEEVFLLQVQTLLGGDILDLFNDAQEEIFVNR